MLRLIVMSTNLEYNGRERRRKRENGRQASEAQREKERRRARARDKEPFFVGRTTWICSGGEKMRNTSGHLRKWQAVKNVNKNMYDISSIERVTRKFLDLSRCSRAKQRQRNVQKKKKKCSARAKLFLFCLLDQHLLLFFQSSRCLCPLALHDFIFSLSKP